MEKIPEWNREALLHSPLFAPLHPLLAEFGAEHFPALDDCNALLALRPIPITARSGAPLRFVAQQCGKLQFAAQYEPRCYLKGEVATRTDNWHDLFNALVWLTFPKTKAVLNARHYHVLTNGTEFRTNAGRGAVRDVNMLGVPGWAEGNCSETYHSISKLTVQRRRVRSTHHYHWCVERTLHDHCCFKIELELRQRRVFSARPAEIIYSIRNIQ